MRSGSTARRLPNAPLVEVVFEMRWALQGAPGLPSVFHADPGFLQTQEAFTAKAAKMGFASRRDMQPGPELPGGYTISRRFYRAADHEFPLLQIGPGVYAANQSTDYEWPSFRKQVLQGLRAVLDSYPDLPSFPMRPVHLELRYVDAFDEALAGTSDLLQFLNAATHISLTLPNFVNSSQIFRSAIGGRIMLSRPLKARKQSVFALDIGSGSRQEAKIIRLESKIVTREGGVPKLTTAAPFLREVKKWLQFANGITSPFFRELIRSEVMAKFQGQV